ncbi:acyl-CoA dehydrogenase family protein [Gordonia rhizosphera]|uniref:Putative acyl-CoA dehydrogenase n=1 Tax=Gordonia rhizosphera NBRC 16068 TaxID=1108045 RepID=K6VRZ3_9ACTN|nr:acyl-CoA dehydrogenase family protein [Gordonia rhizosphera]GAB89690.1 putative acyl-CoA dehydrogenase [Gordonia rhizosphera NBRC 16068]
MDSHEQKLLADTLRTTMATNTGPLLDKALDELGWPDMLTDCPEIAIPLVFRLLGETGSHASSLNDVVALELGEDADSVVPLPFAGGLWVQWCRDDTAPHDSIDPELPLREVAAGADVPLTTARIALGWWLVGTSRAMLDLARGHALARTQFGRPIAAFQAVRHRLAESLVAIEGAEATLLCTSDNVGALLAKAAAGRAALTTVRHCQQVLGGIGFTAEHPFQSHARRVWMLDSLAGSSRELTRDAGALLRARGRAPRLVDL